jgi:Ca2+-binding RTX toxin-like protein
MITIVGNGHGYVYGGGGADVIKITGDDNPEAAIFGGIGNDDCDAGPEVRIFECEIWG